MHLNINPLFSDVNDKCPIPVFNRKWDIFGHLGHVTPVPTPAWCRAGGEPVGFDAHALEHGDEEVGQRVVVLACRRPGAGRA